MSERQPTRRIPVSAANTLLALAAGAILLWTVLEFAFRRGLVPLLADPLGTALGADALVLAFAFPLIAGIIAWVGVQAGISRADWAFHTSLKSVGAGLAGVVVYFVVYLALLVGITTALGLELPADPGGPGGGEAVTWALLVLFVGNGIVVPIAEELAWRGVIQTALMEAYGTWVGIIVTALAFVGKHLVVDLAAPVSRVASLVVLAFVLGGLRARYGTTASTVAHLAANLLATGSLLFV